MSAYSFFSNNLIYVDGENCEIIKSLKYTRPSDTKFFVAPSHTVGTSNLLVFVDGRLQIMGVDYHDCNSDTVEFYNPIGIAHDVVIVLIKSKQGNIINNNTGIEWGSF